MSRRSRKPHPRAVSPPPSPVEQPRKKSTGLVLRQNYVWPMRAAVLIGVPLLVWALIEAALRVFGVGYPTSFFVPVEINGRDMIVENDRFTWRFLGRRMARQPFPCAVEAKKPADTTRIFVLGESAAYGDPQPEFGLARMLQALLEGRYPGRRFEVVNASMTAINSHALLPLAKDCVNAHAAALVVYMRNNEVVGPFGAGTVFGSPAASLGLIRANLALKKLRSIQMLDSLISSVQTRNGSEREW